MAAESTLHFKSGKLNSVRADVTVFSACAKQELAVELARCGLTVGGNMPGYVVVQIEVKDPIKYEKYKELAPPSIRKYGGRYLVRGEPVETLEGKWSPKRFVILRFDSKEQAKAWWSSPEYREAKLLRQASAGTEMICVQGLDDAL
jgi:uncharacterized protein (DUF1330 family)